MSNLLTPDQKLAVAQEVMPLPKDNDWFLMNDGESIYSTRHGYWNPDTNAEQWKALAIWCAENGAIPCPNFNIETGDIQPWIIDPMFFNV